MITLLKGNMFDIPVDALVNPVNCMGVSGKGLALEFKRRFPEEQREYERICSQNHMTPGWVTYVQRYLPTPSLSNSWQCPYVRPKYIVYFATKDHWRDRSQLTWISAGLSNLTQNSIIQTHLIESLAVPALGCGLGGLRWKDVETNMVECFSRQEYNNIHVYIYAP